MRATFTRRYSSSAGPGGENFVAEWSDTDGIWKQVGATAEFNNHYASRTFDILIHRTPQRDEPHNQTETQDATVMRVATDLLSEHGENSEYDRAIAEMTCYLLGINPEDKAWVLRVLRAMRGTS